MKQKGWIGKFEREFLKKPGEHLMEIGITGSGKTQGLYWILDGLLKNSKNETIVWFDSGKSSEILTLAKLGALNIILPAQTEIRIECSDADIIQKEFINPTEIWTGLLEKDRINIVCLAPYILSPSVYTKVFTKLFTSLIRMAHDYAIPVPMALFIDEFHRIAPSKGNAIDWNQMVMGAAIQHNIETLRSLHVRLICSTHGWMKIRAGVRNSFNWIMPRRGAHFSGDQPKLNRFNPLFEKLDTDQGIITFPTKIFTDLIHFPYYEIGEDIGSVRYVGVFENKNGSHKQEKQDHKIKTPWDVLGVTEGASWDEIKAAYKSMALKYHPDRIATLAPEFIKLAETLMIEINAAYEELKKDYERS